MSGRNFVLTLTMIVLAGIFVPARANEQGWLFKVKGTYYGISSARFSKSGIRMDETFIGAIVDSSAERIRCFNNKKKTYFEDGLTRWARDHAPGTDFNGVEPNGEGAVAGIKCKRYAMILTERDRRKITGEFWATSLP